MYLLDVQSEEMWEGLGRGLASSVTPRLVLGWGVRPTRL